ncbi:MAG: hypothetical protein VR69_12385 [Peptococcaceae bacterium BRH_c4b]|nr:MAG: hypothetical protein VR69_12385 [Peptococcaceae bacterium BRH_c4b]
MRKVLDSIHPHVRKRIFLGLLLLSLLVVGGVTFGVWYLIFYPGRSLLHQIILVLLVGVLAMGVMLAGLGILGIVLSLLYAKKIFLLNGPMRVAVNMLFPVVIGLARLFKFDIDRVKNSYIEVNNQLVRALRMKLKPDQILLLAPHCLQNTECPHKITVDINNCRRCGRCSVSDLLQMRDAYGINMGIATGGTLARKYVKEYRPRAIVAIACERDLTSGIQDSNPVPVLGITNSRPNGPCYNTCIYMPRVEEAVNHFLPGTEGGRQFAKAECQGNCPDGIKGS